jgi:hypothetical protein
MPNVVEWHRAEKSGSQVWTRFSAFSLYIVTQDSVWHLDVFLITVLLATVVGVRGTIISLRSFAHGPEHVSRPRGE